MWWGPVCVGLFQKTFAVITFTRSLSKTQEEENGIFVLTEARWKLSGSDFTDLASVGPQAIGSEGLAPDQDRVLSDSVGRLQQGLHAERHCLHTLPVPVPLKQGTVQWRDDHLIAKHLRGMRNWLENVTINNVYPDRKHLKSRDLLLFLFSELAAFKFWPAEEKKQSVDVTLDG